MRVPFVCGNWKMNKTVGEALQLVDALVSEPFTGIEVGIAPPATALWSVGQRLGSSPVRLAAQNVFWAPSGAFTGELSAPLLRDVGCSYALVGHSERRQHFGETDASCHQKITAALEAGLGVIYCLGETLEERESGQTLAVVEQQVEGGLGGLDPAQLGALVVAYEPVWAIGTGKTATPEQAEQVHAHLRQLLVTRFGKAGEGVRIQYGGSVTPENAPLLFAKPNIDGGLIGGASLKSESFLAICRALAAARRSAV